MKTQIILRVNQDFCGKLCTAVFFNDITFAAAVFFMVDQKREVYVRNISNCFIYHNNASFKSNKILSQNLPV